MKNGSQNTEQYLLDQLRQHLLTDDREELRRLQELIDDPEQLSPKIAPILEARLELMRQNFPKEYEKVVDKLIQRRIQNSQEQIVEVIYPVLGTMIKKYIDHQFQMLKESIEARIAAMQKKLNFWQRLKMRWAGVSEAELMMAASQVPVVHEIYLVERHSGILLAHAAREENLDKESVAGMLTAIKSFVEDAFHRDGEELDYISYHNYKILVENYRSYFLAAMLEGSISAAERAILADKLHQFILNQFHFIQQRGTSEVQERISGLLAEKFINQNNQRQS